MPEKKQQIADTFIDMLSSTALDTLRVEELIQRAGVSKSTFYRLFHDKYDVMHWIVERRIIEISTAAPRIRNWDEWLRLLLQYFLQHKDTFRQIVRYQGSNSFRDFLIEYSLALDVEKICTENVGVSQDDITFSVELFTAGCVHVIILWIYGGCKASIDSVVSSIAKNVPRPLEKYYLA